MEGSTQVLMKIGAYRPYITALIAVALVVFFLPSNDDGTAGVSAGADGSVAGSTASGLTGTTGFTGATTGTSGATTGQTSTGTTGTVGSATGATSGTAGSTGQVRVRLDDAVGVGSTAALANPMCDRRTGRIRVQSIYAPPCVKPWPKGAFNGGATARGVTPTTIRIATLACAPQDAKCSADQGALGAASAGQDQCGQDRSIARIYNHIGYEFWGRKIEMVCQYTHGFDEAAQRADALELASKNVFMVIAFWAGGRVLDTELARRGIMTYTARAPWDDPEKQQPYRWSAGWSEKQQLLATAEVECKSVGRGNAVRAGDAAMRAQPRRFGLVYAGGLPIEKYLVAPLRKCGINLVRKIPYDLGNAASVVGDPTASQQQAPLVVARLSSDRISHVIAFTDPMMTGAMTTQASSQRYSPEWFNTTYKYQDALAATFDQDQWDHAFGLRNATIVTVQRGNAPKGEMPDQSLYWWYYGEGGDTKTNCGSGKTCDAVHLIAFHEVMAGLTLAGPRLTPGSFQRAMFALPPRGGLACDCRTSVQVSFGRHGVMPGTDYFGADDFGLGWYDKTAEQCLGTQCVSGGYRDIFGFKHFVLGRFPTQVPWFHKSKSINGFAKRPPQDLPPKYPCRGCPSSGASYSAA